jgi:splicing factor 3B subunit 2
MTSFGDMYYEGKEYEIIKNDFKPGRLSPALRAALGINETSPPPWLYNM